MKAYLGLSLALIALLGVFSLSGMQRNQLLNEQLDSYERQNSQLLTQIENNSLRNIEADNALRALQNDLNNRNNQLAALSRQLDLAQQSIDPDYEQIESRLRQQLTRELRTNKDSVHPDPRIAALNQLYELDPTVMGEIMSLHAQYGNFIRELDVSEDRKEVVINALHNLIADQNQARTEIILGLQADPQGATRGDMLRQMREISDPSAQLEALAYDLTESELDAFADYQERMQNTSISIGGISGVSASPAGGPILLRNEMILGGSADSPAIQILPISPNN